MNTGILTKKKIWEKKNTNSGMKKMTMSTMIPQNMKTRRESGTRHLTGISLWTLYCPYT